MYTIFSTVSSYFNKCVDYIYSLFESTTNSKIKVEPNSQERGIELKDLSFKDQDKDQDKEQSVESVDQYKIVHSSEKVELSDKSISNILDAVNLDMESLDELLSSTEKRLAEEAEEAALFRRQLEDKEFNNGKESDKSNELTQLINVTKQLAEQLTTVPKVTADPLYNGIANQEKEHVKDIKLESDVHTLGGDVLGVGDAGSESNESIQTDLIGVKK